MRGFKSTGTTLAPSRQPILHGCCRLPTLKLATMLTLSEEVKQTRINEAHRFGLHLAHLMQDDVERLAGPTRRT